MNIQQRYTEIHLCSTIISPPQCHHHHSYHPSPHHSSFPTSKLFLGDIRMYRIVSYMIQTQGRRKHFRIGMAKIIPYHGLTMEGPKVPSKAREARSAAEGVRSGEGRRSPSPVWGFGGYAPSKFFKKSTLKLHIFKHFCKLKIKWSHLQCRQGTYD